MTSSKLNSVQEFYKNKTIFITGGSGFIGKVLIEKLLYSCSEIKQIILLIRAKSGKSERIRVLEFESLPLFQRIMKEKPEVMKKIRPIQGDLSRANLGMSEENFRYVIDNTQIIFHLAASFSQETSFKSDIIVNLTSTKQLIEMAKRMKNLLLMIHTSTAFCNVEYEIVEEKVYDIDDKPVEVMENAEWMNEDAIQKIQCEVLGVHSNSYTYTKRLAEVLIRDEYCENNLPLCIVRPSIIGPTQAEPIVGWADSLNSISGVVLAGAKGVLRCLYLDSDAKYNTIAVDHLINAFILIGKKHGSSNIKSDEIPVYNVSNHETQTVTFGRYYEIVNSMKHECPYLFSLWYPNLSVTLSKVIYWFNTICFQWIPAGFIDFLLLIIGQKPFMIAIQRKLAASMKLIDTFTAKNLNLKTENFEELIAQQSNDEYEKIFIDTKTVDYETYFKDSIYGNRVYCGKDPLTTIPNAKILIKMKYMMDIVTKTFLAYWIFKNLLYATGQISTAMALYHKLQRKLSKQMVQSVIG